MSNIKVEITDANEFHCFKLTLSPRADENGAVRPLEFMLHASQLVELIHLSSSALCEWQKQTTAYLICQRTGFTEAEARLAGLIA